jgi:MacB-like periplasmic core domain
MQTLWQDVRYGVRTLKGAPGFALISLVTLALGIGATTAIFSAVHAVLLRPLPYHDSGRLVLIWNRMVTTSFPHAPIAAPDVVDFRTQASSFEAIAVSDNVPEVALTGQGDPEQIRMANVSANFFSTSSPRLASRHSSAAISRQMTIRRFRPGRPNRARLRCRRRRRSSATSSGIAASAPTPTSSAGRS